MMPETRNDKERELLESKARELGRPLLELDALRILASFRGGMLDGRDFVAETMERSGATVPQLLAQMAMELERAAQLEEELNGVRAFVAAQLDSYRARLHAELADADPYLAGHLGGNLNALATVSQWIAGHVRPAELAGARDDEGDGS